MWNVYARFFIYIVEKATFLFVISISFIHYITLTQYETVYNCHNDNSNQMLEQMFSFKLIKEHAQIELSLFIHSPNGLIFSLLLQYSAYIPHFSLVTLLCFFCVQISGFARISIYPSAFYSSFWNNGITNAIAMVNANGDSTKLMTNK